MTLKEVFKNPDADEYGQFCQFDPYPSNKQICGAKVLMRDSIKLTEMKNKIVFGHIQWIIKEVCTDDDGKEIGVVGWRAVAVKPPLSSQKTSVEGRE